MAISRKTLTAFRSMSLRKVEVQTALAAYLAEHFGMFDAVLEHALRRFVASIDQPGTLDKMVAEYNAVQKSNAKFQGVKR